MKTQPWSASEDAAYAIQNKDGQFYNGNAYGDSRDWSTDAKFAFTYSEKRAEMKMDAFPSYFAGCKIVPV